MAKPEDSFLLWQWANNPEVRASAFSSAPIPWEHHQAWFARKVANESCLMFIAIDERENPVGQVRFDLTERAEAEIDVSVMRSVRGHGYGAELVHLAVEEVFSRTSVTVIHAFIKLENQPSAMVFEKAGFERVEDVVIRGNKAFHFAKWRNYAK